MGAPRIPEYVAWVDLETAGTDATEDLVLEVGIALCHNESGMPIVGTREWVTDPGAEWWRDVELPDVVRQMHEANGLLDAMCGGDAFHLVTIDRLAHEWILELTESTDHVALAGSGVSHFDRRFIRAQLPNLDRRFTYWAYDVGVVRRMLERVAPELVRGDHGDQKAHRALADALDHRTEWLVYEEQLRRLVPEAA